MFLCTTAVAIAMAVIFIPSALAVHDLGFQLDGEVSTQAYTVPPSPPAPAPAIYDWGANTAGDVSTQASPNTNGIFDVTDSGSATTGTEAVTNNPTLVGDGKPFAAASFQRDFRSGSSCSLDSRSTTFCTSDTTTYATGSKDTLGIGNGGWQCNKDNNVNSKIDIMNAYAASFFTGAGGTGDHIIYFGMEKNKNNGTNDVGVWLLQGTASCNAPSGHVNFTGQHQNKDVLVVSEFSNGGGVSSIKAFQWAAAASGPLSGDGGCIDSNDNPDPTTKPVAGCNGLPIFSSDTDCKVAGGNDALCGTTNANCADTTKACGKPWNSTVATPWLTSDATKGIGKNQLVSPDFYEGGINLQKVFGAAGETAPSCFSTIVPDTRSSDTITATLFDFVAAQLGECHSSTTTSPVDAATAGTANEGPPASTIPTETAGDAKVLVKDKTTVTVTGVPSFAGSISWHICGPTAPASGQLCDGSTASSTPACSTTVSCVGVDAGSQSITTNGTYYSPTVTVTKAGRYCFRAEFSSTTNGVPGSSDSRSSECFTVGPVTPTISTQAGSNDPVDLGTAVTDTATLSGTAKEGGSGGPSGSDGSIGTVASPVTLGGKAQGNITFTLYKSDCSTLATSNNAAEQNPQTVAISGDGQYGPVSFTPDAPGTYYWDATYPGDSPNTNAATNTTACPSNAEKVIIRQIPTSVKSKQDWIPNDTATVTSSVGNLAAGGSVRFRLYLGSSTCSNTAVYDETVSVPGGSPSKEVSTSNTGTGAGSLRISTDYLDAADSTKGTYSWLVEYTPAAADTAHLPSSSACNAEHFSITYTNDKGP